ncbi:MAG: DUF6519 domain-containing protein [Acidobacteriota bacterium]|nr:DUF6519 domain-containing protein [Acidobacteriota bacterium]
MSGDFSRLLFNPDKGYNKVYLQQGRVQLDSDWNDQADLLDDRFRRMGQDLFGRHGGPSENPGFEISEHGALRFDGIDDWIAFSKTAALSFKDRQSFTIEMWAAPDGGDQRGGTLLSRFNNVPSGDQGLGEISEKENGYKLVIAQDGTLSFHWVEVDADGAPLRHDLIQSNVPLTFGRYHHIAVTYDGEEMTLYIDTVAVARRQRTGAMGADPIQFAIGAEMSDGRPMNFYGGELSEVRIWNLARSHARLRAGLMKTPEGKDAGGMIACWRFDEGFGTVVKSRVNNLQGSLGDGQAPQMPLWIPPDLWIGPGRYYVQGVLCGQDQVSAFSNQGDLPGFSIESEMPESGIYLAYLEAWEQMITPVQDPQLIEPALNGMETSVRARIVKQVRLARLKELEEPGKKVDLKKVDAARLGAAVHSQLFPEVPNGALAARCQIKTRTPGNQLYRVEIHSSGVPYGSAAFDARGSVAVSDLASNEHLLVVEETMLHHEYWEPGQLVEVFSDLHNPGFLASIIDVGPRGKQLTVYPFPEQINSNDNPRVRRIAGFKWSRNNASRVMPVKSIDFETRIITPSDYVYRDDFNERKTWVEILNDDLLLNNRSTIMVQVDPLSNPFRLTAVQQPLEVDVRQEKHPFVRRWDMSGDSDLWRGGIPLTFPDVGADRHDIVPSAGSDSWIDLEYGLQVRFSDGYFHRGDHWLIPTRSLLESRLEWPADENGPVLKPPVARNRYRGPLALVVKEEVRDGRAPAAADELPPEPNFEDIEIGHQGEDAPPEPPRRYKLKIRDLRRFFGPMPALTERLRRSSQTGSTTSTEPSGPTGGQQEPTQTPSDDLVYLGADPIPPEGFHFTGLSLRADPWSPLAWEPDDTWEGSPTAVLHTETGIYCLLDSGQLQRYDLTDYQLTQCDSLPDMRTRFGACLADGRIYVMGGQDVRGRLSDRVDCYDPETGAWMTLEPLPKPRTDLTLVAAEGRIYAMGGRKHTLFGLIKHITSRIDIYDHESDIWAEGKLPKMPGARLGMAEVTAPNHIYLTGGKEPSFLGLGERDSCIHMIWYFQDQTWVRLTDLPTATDGPAAILGTKGVHLMGGTHGKTALDQHLIYNEQTDRWQQAETLPLHVADPFLCEVGGNLWLIAGNGEATQLWQYVQESRLYVHRPD